MMNEMSFLKVAYELAVAVDPHETAPNPRVGCVAVLDGVIVGQGAHQKYGTAHAEVLALRDLERVDEIYLTLEPCDYFHGKQTPSCTERIIALKPKKVVVGALDPKFQGKNLEKLRAAAIEVEVLEEQHKKPLNPFLEKWHSESPYPYICLKIAQSLDGKITSPTRYITNKTSRTKVHELRSRYSALLTSTETILQDDPRLDVRWAANPGSTEPGFGEQGTRSCSNPSIVIVGERVLSADLKVFQILDRDIEQYRTRDLDAVLRDLKAKGIDSVLVEVGQTLNTEFVKQGFADEIQIFTAPVFLGESEKAALGAEMSLTDFTLTETAELDGDVWWRYVNQ